MSERKVDLAVFVYNFAVVVSGVFLAAQFDSVGQLLLLGPALAVAVFWTVYFRYSMLSRLDTIE